MPKLLTLLSNPDNAVKLRMDREIKEIQSRISPKVSHDFEIRMIPAINIDELPGILVREKPELLHFSGHGNKKLLCFEDRAGKTHNITVESLKVIFKEAGQYITCLLINACESADLARTLSSYIPYVIGFPAKIEDELSETFSKTYYETLSLGHPVSSCFEMAKATIMSGLPQNRIPILYENKKLFNYGKVMFREPYLTAFFEINDHGRVITQDGLYCICLDVKNLPLTTSYIIYEFIDDTIPKSLRFDIVKDLSSGSYSDENFLYGDIVVRAWLWFGEKNYGIGIQSSLSECLERYYKGSIPSNCRVAFREFKNN